MTAADSTCRGCGCTEARACDAGGCGCWWVEAPDPETKLGLCSVCAGARWFWADSLSAERWNGPHRTRDAAVGEAQQLSEAETLFLAPGLPVRAEDQIVAALDLDRVLENLEEFANDNGVGNPDDQTFEVRGNTIEAEEALAEALRAWARQWLGSTWYVVDVDRGSAAVPPLG